MVLDLSAGSFEKEEAFVEPMRSRSQLSRSHEFNSEAITQIMLFEIPTMMYTKHRFHSPSR